MISRRGELLLCDIRFGLQLQQMVEHRLDSSHAPPEASERRGPSLEIGPLESVEPSMTSAAERFPADSSPPGAAAYSDVSGPGVAVLDALAEIGPSLAFTGALEEFGLWSVFRIDASTQPPRLPSTGGDYFFTLPDANLLEVYREPMAVLVPVHGEIRQAWAVRVPLAEQLPAFLAILDAQDAPLFIEPLDLSPSVAEYSNQQ